MLTLLKSGRGSFGQKTVMQTLIKLIKHIASTAQRLSGQTLVNFLVPGHLINLTFCHQPRLKTLK